MAQQLASAPSNLAIFRANTAQTYLHLFIASNRRCVIKFNCGTGEVTGEEFVLSFTILLEMFYHGVDPMNEARVIFEEGNATQLEITGEETFDQACESLKYNAWRERTETFLHGRFDLTPYVISIYGKSMDSALPQLQCDVQKKQISFEWEGMLDAFIRERKEVARLDEWADQDYERRYDDAVKRGGLWAGVPILFQHLAGLPKRNAVQVRRRWIAERMGSGFAIDEKHGMKQMQRIRAAEAQGIGSDEWVKRVETAGKEGDGEEGDAGEEIAGSLRRMVLH